MIVWHSFGLRGSRRESRLRGAVWFYRISTANWNFFKVNQSHLLLKFEDFIIKDKKSKWHMTFKFKKNGHNNKKMVTSAVRGAMNHHSWKLKKYSLVLMYQKLDMLLKMVIMLGEGIPKVWNKTVNPLNVIRKATIPYFGYLYSESLGF